MEFGLSFLIGLIVGVFILLVVVFFVYNYTQSPVTTVGKDVMKRNLCAKWVMNNCDIMDKVYTKDLIEAQICQPCELPGVTTTGMDATRIKTAMEAACGEKGDKTWSDCKKECGCPYEGGGN